MDEKKGDLPAFLDRKSTQAAAAVRKAFFTEGRDISDWDVHREIASEIDVDYEKSIGASVPRMLLQPWLPMSELRKKTE